MLFVLRNGGIGVHGGDNSMANRKKREGSWRESLPPTNLAFRPYVTALGQLALAWNELHETMCLLFCTVMGGGFIGQYLAVWHTIKSDRAQREVLFAAISSDTNRPINDPSYEHLKGEIKWICGKADSLEETRNNALHSPLFASGDNQALLSLQIRDLATKEPRSLKGRIY